MRLHGVRYLVEADLASYLVPSTHSTLVTCEG
jgi:hypothetical protein